MANKKYNRDGHNRTEMTEREMAANRAYAKRMITEIGRMKQLGNLSDEFASEQIAKYNKVYLNNSR
jgi:hypothetical protein